MNTNSIQRAIRSAMIAGLFLVPLAAYADIATKGVFDTVLDAYATTASTWAGVIKAHASRLFWLLALLSMVWTFGMLLLRKADIGEFFAEFFRFTVFTGFFWWLLDNGPAMAIAIINSLRKIGADATGAPLPSPSGIVDIGFEIFSTVVERSSIWSPFTSAVGIALSIIILLVLALLAVNMLLLLVSAWVLAYAGIFFLGFGGARWTSDIAIGYFKTVIGVAAQIMGMILLVGIGKSFIDTFYSHMSADLRLTELAAVMVASVILLALVNKVPAMLGNLIPGGGAAGVGGLGVGSIIAGAAAVSAAGSVLAAGAASAGGGALAMHAAFAKASEEEKSIGGAGPMEHMEGTASGGGGHDSSMLPSGGQSGNSDSGAKQAPTQTAIRAARIAAFMTSHLASGAATMATEGIKKRTEQTFGGRLAKTIAASPSAKSATSHAHENTLSAGADNEVDAEAEIKAFVDRENPPGDDNAPDDGGNGPTDGDDDRR